MKKSILIISAISLFIISCGQSKQFDTCTDMASDLRYKNYDDLEKEFGEPYEKDIYHAGNTWDIMWKGVGVNGHDVKVQFENFTTSWGSDSPHMFRGIVDCNE